MTLPRGYSGARAVVALCQATARTDRDNIERMLKPSLRTTATRSSATIAVAVTVLVLFASCAAARTMTRSGVVSGVIYFVGGPAPIGKRAPSTGWIHVRQRSGAPVASAHIVSAARGFRLKLAPGAYLVSASETRKGGSLGCKPVQARVRAGRDTALRISIGCDVP